MIPFARGLALVMLLSSSSFAQLQVCDGRNHLNTTTTGAWGLPAARTLGVRFVPAATLVVERIEWFFGPSTLSTVVGGTQSVILEDTTTNLPSTNPIDVVAQDQWTGTTTPPAWDGATFSAPILLQGGTVYWLTTTAGPTTTHQAPSYDDGGPDATSYAVATGGTWVAITTPHNFKVRLMAGSCGGGPIADYQVNQIAASADVNGVQGTTSAPAEVTLAIGQAAVLTLSSSLSTPWDVGYGLAPLVPAGGGGLTLPDGQIVNMDLTDPTFNFLFAPPLSGPTFVISAIPVNTASPLALSFQLILLNPSAPTGVALSQANRLVVQ